MNEPDSRPGPGETTVISTPAGAPTRRRDRLTPGRRAKVTLRLSDAEYEVIAEAARRAGIGPSGYAAESAHAAALGDRPPRPEPWREPLLELMAARAQLRNLAVEVRSALDEADSQPADRRPADGDRVLQAIATAVAGIDVAAARIARSQR